MSEENTTAGMAAFCEYYSRQAGAAVHMPSSWEMQSEPTRADWEAAATAAIANVVNPTAEDYDHAAEILKLRDLVGRATVVIACYADRVAFANELRAEAGLEALAPLGEESRRDALDAQTLHDSPGADL